jgi:serine protease AprX
VVGDRERVGDATLLARDRAALRWVLANRERYDIRVVNLSLGDRIGACTPAPSPLAPQLEALFRAGVVPVMSGGNNGARGGCGVNSYANSPNTLRVGAVFRPSDPAHGLAVTPFSGRGPSRPTGAVYSQADSPTLTAPGDRILVANALDGGRFRDSGTSFAAPFVAGTALALRTLSPQASAAQLRDALLRSAADRGRPGRDRAFGVGVVDPLAAADVLAPGVLPDAERRLDLPATAPRAELPVTTAGPASRSLVIRLDRPSRVRIAAEPALRRRPPGDPQDLFSPTRLSLTRADGTPVPGVGGVPVRDPYFFGITRYGTAYLTSGTRVLPAGSYRLTAEVANPRGLRPYDLVVDVQVIPAGA